MIKGAIQDQEIVTQEEIDFLNSYHNKYPKDQLKKFTEILKVFNSGNKVGAKALIDALLPTDKPNYELFKADIRRVKEIEAKQERLKKTVGELKKAAASQEQHTADLYGQRQQIINQGARQFTADMNSYGAGGASVTSKPQTGSQQLPPASTSGSGVKL